jgi:prepilin peptidase CpaA
LFLNAVLIGLLTLAVTFDLKERRIPNWLVLTGIITVLGYYLTKGNYHECLISLKGLGLGIALLLIPFLMGGMGAGDVKLLGMVGAFKGSVFVFNCFIWMALIGGFIAGVLLLKRHRLVDFIKRAGRGVLLARCKAIKLTDVISTEELSIYYPYGTAIGLGAVAAFFKGWC